MDNDTTKIRGDSLDIKHSQISYILEILTFYFFQDSRIIIEKINSTSNEKYFNFSATINSDHSLNISTEIFSPMDDLRIYVNIGIPKDENDQKYENIIFKTTLNICKLLQGKAGDLMSRTIVMIAKTFANKEMKCPTVIGKTFLTSVVLEDGFVPKMLLSRDIKAYIWVRMIGKVLAEKKTAEFLNIKIYAKISK